jgi:hypothetical protein
MVTAAVVTALAVVWCSSLVFVNAVVRRAAEQDRLDSVDHVEERRRHEGRLEARARGFAEKRRILLAQRAEYEKLWQTRVEEKRTDEANAQNWRGMAAIDKQLMALADEEARP